MHPGPWRGPGSQPPHGRALCSSERPPRPCDGTYSREMLPWPFVEVVAVGGRVQHVAVCRGKKPRRGTGRAHLARHSQAWAPGGQSVAGGTMLGGVCGVCDPASHRAAPRGDTGQGLGSSSLNRAPGDKPLRLGGPWRLLGLQKEGRCPALPTPPPRPVPHWRPLEGGRCGDGGSVRGVVSRPSARRMVGGQGPTRACVAGAPGQRTRTQRQRLVPCPCAGTEAPVFTNASPPAGCPSQADPLPAPAGLVHCGGGGGHLVPPGTPGDRREARVGRQCGARSTGLDRSVRTFWNQGPGLRP